MSEMKIAMAVEQVAKIISGAPFPSKASLSKARKVVESLEVASAPQWQPIETAPKDGRPLLLDHPGWHTRVLRGAWDAHELAWRVHGFGCPATQPAHWQPLPAPPEVKP